MIICDVFHCNNCDKYFYKPTGLYNNNATSDNVKCPYCNSEFCILK